MKSKIAAISLFVITAAVVVFYPVRENTANANNVTTIKPIAHIAKPKIQMAILLDTSGSMSGLIDQTRNQLWQVVNQFSKSKQNGITPVLEVAVYEYGNSGLSSQNGYIRQVSALTSELDQVSEALFSLSTNGGEEYCGFAIRTAVEGLNWSKSDNDIKAIFIAGNEPFTQGPVSFHDAIAAAKLKGITINTIHAGDSKTGANTGWRDGAILAGGDYMSINHNHKVAHIKAPQDKRLAELNAKLNKTYVPYGSKGREKARRQVEQDKKSQALSPALMSKRTQSKASSLYSNGSWDLVDAISSGKADLSKMEDKDLPAEMRKMSKKKQIAFVEEQEKVRAEIKDEIKKLGTSREAFVKEQRLAAPAPAVKTVEEAVSAAVRKQGERKNFSFESR